VLVIDDEEAVRRTAARVLERAGYEVEQAPTGEAGVARAREAAVPFDLVIVDFTMPGMNGIETLAAIRGFEPDLRAVLLSGYHEADLPRGAGVAFLQKPYDRRDLVEIVTQALRPDGAGTEQNEAQGTSRAGASLPTQSPVPLSLA
jgi:two-component system, cell cycle sensor histidine kinase and response regulator CckA